MPPVLPRVSTTLSKSELAALKSIARKRERPLAWIIREAIRKVIEENQHPPTKGR